MKITNITQNNEQSYLYSELKGSLNNISLRLSGDSSNCKLSYIHCVGSLQSLDNKTKKEILDDLLTKAKGCIIINTIVKSVADFIAKTYPTYYYNEVPIGYNNTFQYHICIKNTIMINGNCKDPQKEVKENNIDTKIISDKLINILTKKRRKTDFVEEFIKTL